ncbi:MAG: vanadium-dependent haloperoxidase [Saprospiraceae bacterium]|nr:vanadium-dependent haloperoxidase [Lewinella sp.]
MRINLLYLLALLVPIFVITSCSREEVIVIDLPDASEYNSTIPLAWNELLLNVERFTDGYRPPVSARTSAYIALTAYEAIVHGTNGQYNSFAGFLDHLELPLPEVEVEYDWELCLNAAYEAAFFYYYPTAPASQQFHIINLADRLERELEERVSQEIFNRSVAYGHDIAHAIYKWSETDHWGHEGFLKNVDANYIPPTGNGLWRPTFPDFAPALLPHWGKVRTFAATAADVGPPPPVYSEETGSEFYEQARAVRELVNRIKQGARPEDRWIAEFWSDDCPILTFTPPTRMISITNQIVEREDVSLDFAVYAYAKVCFALCDAGIKSWEEKYKYNCERPIDFIRRVIGDTEWNTIMCPDGSGAYFTPPFPAYPSGHATFAAAAAEVLADLFGSNYSFTDRSHEGRTEFNGNPRAFENFYNMAQENAYSRVPLGVHFQSDSDAGLELGYKVGERVNALPWRN